MNTPTAETINLSPVLVCDFGADFADQTYIEGPELRHQRPDGVLGEWNQIPEEDWNIHQRIAEKTHGIVTVANFISILGAAATVKGGLEYARGNRAWGTTLIGIGRVLDLVDGEVSARLGTRGKVGAATDAFLDKGLTAAAVVALPLMGTVSPEFAIETGVQQIEVAQTNLAIKREGGEPNPNAKGKHFMAKVWLTAGARLVQQTLQGSGHKISGKVMEKLGDKLQGSAKTDGEKSLTDYKDQLKRLKAAKKYPLVDLH